jgi:hypothetical protein
MKFNFDNFPILSLLKSLFTDTNKARVAGQMDEIRRFFLYEAEHWYVLISLAMMSVPMIMMSAGKDIAYGLFDNQQYAYGSSFVFIIEFCWVLLLFALICWRLPLHYVDEKYINDATDDLETPITEGVNFRERMRQKTYRFNGFLVFALMIVWIISFAKVKMGLWDIVGMGLYVVSLWILSDFFAKHLDKQRLKWQSIEITATTSFLKRLRYQKPLLAAFVPCVAAGLVLLAVSVAFSFSHDDVANYFVLAGSLGFTAVLFYVFADYVDRIAYEKREVKHLTVSLRDNSGFWETGLKKFLKAMVKPFSWFVYLFITHNTRQDLSIHSWKKPFLYIHVFCFVHVALATLFFCLVPNMQAIHPIFCIIYGVSFVVFVLDWLNYIFYRKYYVFARWTLLLFALVLIAMTSASIWAMTDGQKVSKITIGANLILLLITLKWLRFPNTESAKSLIVNGESVDKSMFQQAVMSQAQSNNKGFLSEDITTDSVVIKGMNNPVTRWLGTPMRFLEARELSVFGIGIVFMLLINLAMPNVATHNLALLNKANETPQMPTLLSPKDYITGWLDNRQEALRKDSFDVYIVAGQGGGSRGAYWFSKIMTEMDALTEGSFRQQCLAISTVSGSSVGGQGIISLWDSIPFTKENNAKILMPFSHNAFQHNYLSGNLADVFFKDNIAAFWPSTGDFNPLTLGRGDRNHRLQHEEAVRIEEALEGGEKRVDGEVYLSLFKAFKLKSLDNCLTNAPFWSFYYDYATNKPRYKVPLFFANTCQVQGGKRSFVSPIQNDPRLFVNTFDLTSRLIRHKKSISLTSAANLSELFPYLSMASRLAVKDSLEINFVDGGYYENYGLTTAYELIRYCADSLKMQSKYKGIRLHLVAIINSQDAVADNTIQGISQITAPVQAVMGSIFGGHADHKLLEMEAKSGKDGFIFHKIQLPKIDENSYVPLSRMLSMKSIKYLDNMVDSLKRVSPMKDMAH